MFIISHRGNINGPNAEKENKPEYIDYALNSGFEVEIDLRISNYQLYLGHDSYETPIDVSWLETRKNKLWIHCKDLESAIYISNLKSDFKFFCHNNDPYVLTSTHHIWVHDMSLRIDESCIIPLINNECLKSYRGQKVFAICSDYKNILQL